MVRKAGEGAEIREGDTKSGKPRAVDLDDDAAAVLRAWKRERGAMTLQLVTSDALVFGTIEGQHRNPEHVSRQFARDIERCGQVDLLLGAAQSEPDPSSGRAAVHCDAQTPQLNLRLRNGSAAECQTLCQA